VFKGAVFFVAAWPLVAFLVVKAYRPRWRLILLLTWFDARGKISREANLVNVVQYSSQLTLDRLELKSCVLQTSGVHFPARAVVSCSFTGIDPSITTLYDNLFFYVFFSTFSLTSADQFWNGDVDSHPYSYHANTLTYFASIWL
jgi:hypothetical protein